MNQEKQQNHLEALDERIKELEKFAPKARATSKKPSNVSREEKYNCPKCSCEMDPGEAAVYGNFLIYINNWFLFENLWFQPDGSNEKILLLASRDNTDGYHCKSCGSTFLIRKAYIQ